VRKPKDISDKVYNRLTCLKRLPPENGTAYGLFRCVCGKEIKANVYAVTHNKIKSCGCLRSEVQKGRKRRPYLPAEHVALTLAFNAVRQGARHRGLPFELTRKQFGKIVALSCSYCDAPPSNKWKFRDKEYAYSGIDRLDNRLGYTVDNAVPCCAQCNRAKGTLDLEEFVDWIRKVHECVSRR